MRWRRRESNPRRIPAAFGDTRAHRVWPAAELAVLNEVLQDEKEHILDASSSDLCRDLEDLGVLDNLLACCIKDFLAA